MNDVVAISHLSLRTTRPIEPVGARLAAVRNADNAEIARLRKLHRRVEQQIDYSTYDLASTGTG